MRFSSPLLSRFSRFAAVGAFLWLVSPLVCAHADQTADWNAVNQLREELNKADPLLQQQPALAIERLRAFESSRELHPLVQADVTVQIAEITRVQLKQPDQALALIDGALDKVEARPDATMPLMVMYLESKAAILLQQDKAAQAKTLLQEHLPEIEAAARFGHPHLVVYGSRALQRLCDAQKASGAKPEETIALLQYALEKLPVYLDPKKQKSLDWKNSWMYERLIELLSQSGNTDEALQWGKLYFGQVPFKSDATQRAMQSLSAVWVRSGEMAKVRSFAAAQSSVDKALDATSNPLAQVELPDLSGTGAAKSELELLRTQTWRGATDRITLEIALGQWRAALDDALGMMVEDAASPAGPQQVARVLKAHDGSLARANAFLAYLQGKGENPIPAFQQELAAGGANG